MRLNNNFILCAFFYFIQFIFSTISSPIYDSLIKCYRGNEIKSFLPQTEQILIELIRKIEDSFQNVADVRMISTALMHSLRIDGIEREPNSHETKFVTPYGVHGIMDPKFKILLNLISNETEILNFQRILSKFELCHLHRIISSTVQPWERGDEQFICPIIHYTKNSNQRPHHHHHQQLHRHHWIKPFDGSTITPIINHRRISRCPIEGGVIRTRGYSTIAPGNIIASIAAGLQPQSVAINRLASLRHSHVPYENLESMRPRDTKKIIGKLLRSVESVENIYSANLAGDLAEICVYQGPYVGTNTSIGVHGHWNDTKLPRIHYIHSSHDFPDWEMTDSEVLSGIDSIFLAKKVSMWTAKVKRLRLSQIFDLYYSSRGLPMLSINLSQENQKPNHILRKAIKANPFAEEIFSSNDQTEMPFDRLTIDDGITNACQRKNILNTIDRKKLKEETYHLSQVLQFKTSSVSIKDDQMRKICDATVDRYFKYAEHLIEKLPKCGKILEKPLAPSVDLGIIIDEMHNEYLVHRLISFLSEAIDISKFGSFLHAVNGGNGDRLVNRTQSITKVFEQLRNYTFQSSNGLLLSRSLATYLETISMQMINEKRSKVHLGLPLVLVITCKQHPITNHDFANARRLIQRAIQQHPDLHIIFITTDERFVNDLMYGNENTGKYFHINANFLEIHHYENELMNILNQLPRRIFPNCFIEHNNTYENDAKDYSEEYVTPGRELIYRVNGNYLKDNEYSQVEFGGNDFGTFTVCMKYARESNDFQCQNVSSYETIFFNLIRTCENDVCNDAYFTVSVDTSSVNCLDNTCRYPDQVRFTVRHKDLQCSGSSTIRPIPLVISILIVVISIRIIKKFL